MKISVHRSLLMLALILSASIAMAQTALAPDQNPDFAVSRAKYMKMSDSINTWQGTTAQETYKAIDYLADKAEARANRRAFRQQLRMERARYGYSSYDWNNSLNYYNNGWGNYGNYNNFYSPYRYNRRNNFSWNLGLGWWWRW